MVSKEQFEALSLQLKAAVAAEIEWEKAMMQVVGEDGIADVVSAIEKLKTDGAALAAENAYLLPKAASELSNAWVLHKYLIGIQAAIMYLDNGNKKAAQEWLYGTIAGPGFDFPDEVEDIEEWATHQMRGSISHPRAFEIIKAETPATDAFIAEQQAIGVEKFVEVKKKQLTDMHPDTHAFGATAMSIRSQINELQSYAQQLRDEVKS